MPIAKLVGLAAPAWLEKDPLKDCCADWFLVGGSSYASPLALPSANTVVRTWSRRDLLRRAMACQDSAKSCNLSQELNV